MLLVKEENWSYKCLLSSPVIKTEPLKIVSAFKLKICGCDLLFGGSVQLAVLSNL